MTEKKPVILLVDDKKENLLSLEALLEEVEARLVSVQSGMEALEFLLKEEPSLILLDVQMPGMSGYEVAEMIRSREKTRFIPIIFITAISQEEEFIFKGYETGAIDYLLKPITPFILISKVKVFLELAQKENALKKALKDREVLIREVHHRVKNNLTILSSFIYLESLNHSEMNRTVFHNLQGRLDTILLIHEQLYTGESLEKINTGKYLEDLLANIISSLSNYQIDSRVEYDPLTLSLDQTISLGLMITEMASNSIKYAFGNMKGETPLLSLSIKQLKNEISLCFRDNGSGFPPQEEIRENSLGLTIISSMAEQLYGSLDRKNEKGTLYRLTFPPEEISGPS